MMTTCHSLKCIASTSDATSATVSSGPTYKGRVWKSGNERVSRQVWPIADPEERSRSRLCELASSCEWEVSRVHYIYSTTVFPDLKPVLVSCTWDKSGRDVKMDALIHRNSRLKGAIAAFRRWQRVIDVLWHLQFALWEGANKVWSLTSKSKLMYKCVSAGLNFHGWPLSQRLDVLLWLILLFIEWPT